MEMTCLLGSFVESHLPAMNDQQVQQLSKLLEHRDVVLYPWLNGTVLPEQNNEVMVMLLRYVNPKHPALRQTKSD